MYEIQTPDGWELNDENETTKFYRKLLAEGLYEVSVGKLDSGQFFVELAEVNPDEVRVLWSEELDHEPNAYSKAHEVMSRENECEDNFETLLEEQQEGVEIESLDILHNQPVMKIETDGMTYKFDLVECDCFRCQDPESAGPYGYPVNPRAMTHEELGEYGRDLNTSEHGIGEVPTDVFDRAEEHAGYYSGPFAETDE